jgi:hypothetical protein
MLLKNRQRSREQQRRRPELDHAGAAESRLAGPTRAVQLSGAIVDHCTRALGVSHA